MRGAGSTRPYHASHGGTAPDCAGLRRTAPAARDERQRARPFKNHCDRMPKVLLVTTQYWASAARQAIALQQAGLTVEAVCRRGHALEATGAVTRFHRYRSLWPLDLPTLVASVKKTGRCVVVHEATRTSGFGAELVALVQEHCFYHLEAPIERVTGWDTPYPHAQEWAYFPGPARVAAAFRRAMEK